MKSISNPLKFDDTALNAHESARVSAEAGLAVVIVAAMRPRIFVNLFMCIRSINVAYGTDVFVCGEVNKDPVLLQEVELVSTW